MLVKPKLFCEELVFLLYSGMVLSKSQITRGGSTHAHHTQKNIFLSREEKAF